MNITQLLICLLFLDAAVVAIGMIEKKNMWPCITLYWVILTVKNAIDWLRTIVR